MLTTRQAHDETIFAKLERPTRARAEAKLKAQAKALGFQLIPTPVKA